MDNKNRISYQTRTIGNGLTLQFETEIFAESDILETKVKVYDTDITLCWITNDDVNAFTEELKKVVNKYRI